MATSNRDVTLKLSVETLGEDGITELQKAVEALGRDGGAAAPEFQRLADEIGRLGEQSKALSTFRELSEETDKLAARQADSAASTAQMAAKLQELAAATAQARDRQREATNDLVTGQQAQAKATAALRELKAEYNAAGKNTKDYRDKLLEAVQAQGAANVELVTLRQNQKEANAEVTAAVSAQSKQETQVKKSAAQTDRLAEALQKQTDALRESTTAAEALGVSTEDVAQSEGRLLVALQASAQTANQRSAAIKEMTEADRLLAIEEKAMADLLARGQAALQAETLAQRDAARATEQYAATKREAAAANDAWQKEAEALVNAAHAAQQLARETEILAAAQRELANQNAFEKQATEAQKLLQAAQYVKFWENALEQAETQVKQTADEAQKAAQRIDNAFGTLGVRSVQAVQQEIAETRAAMATLAATAGQTGSQLSGAFAAGENKIKVLEREIRELTGTLTTADKAAGLFKNSLGQIAAGNLIADAVGAIVEKVKDMGRQFIASIVQLDTFRRAMNAVYKDTALVASQLEFLRKTAADGGVGVGGLSDSFVKFSASMKSANVPVQQSNELFASLTRAAGSLGLGAERTSLALDALSQIASKGVVSMEELRQQLGDSLPGALSLTAKGLGVTDAELVKLVESGNLAARDFFPAFTKGLKELHGETEGLVPTWERLKNAFTLAAQNAGDAGWLEILTMGLRGLGLAAGSVLLPLNALFELMAGLIRSGGALAAAIVTWTNPMEALSEIWGQAADRQSKLTEAFDATIKGVSQTTAATTQLTSKVQETIASTDGLTNSQKLAAVAAKLNGDATLDAAAKYVQLSIASATLIKQQENETLNLERVAKARKEEGETLIALAKLRGDEQGILEATSQAAEEYAAASARVAASKQEELRILEQQLVAQRAKLVADKATADQQEKETQKLRELIKTKQAEVEQTKASTEAAKQEVAARRLAVEMYGNQSAKMAEFRAEMDRLTLVLQEYEKLNVNGKKTDEEVAAVRQKLAEVTAKYRDTLRDTVEIQRLETAEVVAGLQAKQASLSVDLQIAQASANIAKLRGDNTLAMHYEREAMAKQIEVAKIKIEIDRVQAQLQIQILNLKKQELNANDANYALQVRELDLKIKLQEITLKELEGAGKLIRLKETENSLRQQATNGLGGEATARSSVTEASEKQADAMAKMLMQYTMSAEYSERQIALLEREAAAAEKAAEAKRKYWNVDKEGYSLNTAGERVLAGESQDQIDKAIADLYGAENVGNADAQRARQLRELAKLRSKGNNLVTQPGLSADERRELQELEARLLNTSPRAGSTTSGGSTPSVPSAPTGGRSGGSGVSGGTKTVTVNINGRNFGSVSDLNDTQANQLVGVLRQLETFRGTAQ